MIQIVQNLFIGNDYDCQNYKNSEDFSIVHACKTCHQKALKYSGNLNNQHPYYLVYQNLNDIYLNMIDIQKRLIDFYTRPIINSALDFIERELRAKRKVLIHCNKGESRAPSIAMLYLAKRARTISNNSYEEAAEDFRKILPSFSPTNGIKEYMEMYWKIII